MPDLNLFQSVLDDLTIAVVIADIEHKILYHNSRFTEWFGSVGDRNADFIDCDFYQSINFPFFIDGCYAPFHFAYSQNKGQRTVLSYPSPNEDETGERRFEMLVSPTTNISNSSGTPLFKIELKEISEMNRYERRLQTLRKVGAELAFFTNEKRHSSEEVLKKRLTEAIESQMRRVLNYDVCEIRLLNKKTNELLPFLNFGMDVSAVQRTLHASSNDNGITGFVASSGEPYICNDAKNDALYISGAKDVKSSLTVPLVFNNEVIGVCNVESRNPNAFSKRDLLFLELYAKDLTFAIHLLEYTHDKDLFVREQCGRTLHNRLDAAFQSLLEIVCKVGFEAENADVKFQIPGLGALVAECYSLRTLFNDSTQNLLLAPLDETDDLSQEEFPNFDVGNKEKWNELCQKLQQKKVLLVSQDPSTLSYQSEWLKKIGCHVETATSSLMALQSLQFVDFDIVISDRYPDGRYFDDSITKEEAHDDESNGVNKFSLSRYDIHAGPSYFVPAEGNSKDREERNRIHHEIYNNRKLDAFFLLQEMYARNYSPLFILMLDDKYDPTHTRENINMLRKRHGYEKRMEPTFPAPNSSEPIWKFQRAFFKKLGHILQ